MILPDASWALRGYSDHLDVYPSLLQHYSNGSFDSRHFLLSRNKRRLFDLNHYGWDSDSPELEATDDLAKSDPPSRQAKRKRTKRIILARRTEDGTLEAIPPTESLWYLLYVDCPQTGDKRFADKFRRRFRLPYQSYLELVEDARAKNWFPRWSGRDAAGKESKPQTS